MNKVDNSQEICYKCCINIRDKINCLDCQIIRMNKLNKNKQEKIFHVSFDDNFKPNHFAKDQNNNLPENKMIIRTFSNEDNDKPKYKVIP